MGESKITRRAALKAAPAVAVAMALPAVAVAAGESEIERLFGELLRVSADWLALDADAADAAFDEMIDPLQTRIDELPASTHREMLIKMVVATRGNEFCPSVECFREAVTMLGARDASARAYPYLNLGDAEPDC